MAPAPEEPVVQIEELKLFKEKIKDRRYHFTILKYNNYNNSNDS
jgi:hypothetical protein